MFAACLSSTACCGRYGRSVTRTAHTAAQFPLLPLWIWYNTCILSYFPQPINPPGRVPWLLLVHSSDWFLALWLLTVHISLSEEMLGYHSTPLTDPQVKELGIKLKEWKIKMMSENLSVVCLFLTNILILLFFFFPSVCIFHLGYFSLIQDCIQCESIKLLWLLKRQGMASCF